MLRLSRTSAPFTTIGIESMSVYPQSMYGQTPYGVSGYPPRPPAVFQHQYYQPPQPQQPPPPIYHVDPNSFRRDFTSRLSNLTFNSRIHIQDLSLMAQDHPQFASIVVQCIDQHLRQVSIISRFSLKYTFQVGEINRDWD